MHLGADVLADDFSGAAFLQGHDVLQIWRGS
jgi:hypothetical protein